MKSILFVLSTLLFVACSNTGGSGVTAKLDGFKTENAGSGVTIATKTDSNGNLLEKGTLVNGAKSGMWMTYYGGEKDAGRIRTIASYANGILSGPYLELSNRGQIDTEVNYRNNKYHGAVTSYKFGRPTTIKNYKDGELDGLSTDYFSDGVVQKEVNFKDGKQHGNMKWYNEAGEVTMEYEYKNGEKVSGGIVKSGE